jgi:predicted phosphodiesterase
VRYLILSDIHANREALDAVVEQAAGQYDEVLCCGDLVGYGADPNPVVDWVRTHSKTVVRGNHDKASTGLDDLEWFNPVARAAALWTARALTPENIAYVRGLPQGPLTAGGFQLVHGSPYDEDEYLLGAAEAVEAFGYLDGMLAFFGHTHVQGGFLWNHARVETIAKVGPRAGSQALDLDPACAYMINPGSVGQPRDGDPRAAYIVFDADARHLRFCRVAYAIERTQARILQAGLPPALAERLAIGR